MKTGPLSPLKKTGCEQCLLTERGVSSLLPCLLHSYSHWRSILCRCLADMGERGRDHRSCSPNPCHYSVYCISSWDLSGWPQCTWVLQVTQSTKKGEPGKGRCLCLAFLLLTHTREQHFETARQADLGTVHLCALPEQHQKGISSIL